MRSLPEYAYFPLVSVQCYSLSPGLSISKGLLTFYHVNTSKTHAEDLGRKE